MTGGNLEARVTGLDGAPDDIADIGRAVNRMAAAQAATVASLRQVSADIAHDLKTPIQRVSVQLSRLEEAGLSGEQAEIAARARQETSSIVKTFQSLLQIAQIEGGRIEEQFSRFDLGDVVAGIVDVFEPTAEESGHNLVLVREGPAFVTGERQLLGQVTTNLIENALRHAPPGSRIEVAVGAGPKPFLRVSDDGPGIPEDERDNVLKRHYRLERSRTTEGSGLGLALVSAIADLHKAELKLGDAEPGLTVTLTFPEA